MKKNKKDDKKKWVADFGNDPYDDYNLIVDVGLGEKFMQDHIATIRQSPQGLLMTWYPQKEERVIPIDWLLPFLLDVNEELRGMQVDVIEADGTITKARSPIPPQY